MGFENSFNAPLIRLRSNSDIASRISRKQLFLNFAVFGRALVVLSYFDTIGLILDRNNRGFARKCRTMFSLEETPRKFPGLALLNYVDKKGHYLLNEEDFSFQLYPFDEIGYFRFLRFAWRPRRYYIVEIEVGTWYLSRSWHIWIFVFPK